MEDDNSFTSTNSYSAGIQFDNANETTGGSLTITAASDDAGSLTATGGSYGAGIGGGYKTFGNNITISGGTVTASSTTDSATSDGDSDDTTSAQTGDDTNITLWIAFILAACAGLTGMIVYSHKKKYNK